MYSYHHNTDARAEDETASKEDWRPSRYYAGAAEEDGERVEDRRRAAQEAHATSQEGLDQ